MNAITDIIAGIATPKDLTDGQAWTDRFAFDIALRLENSGEPLAEILSQHNMTRADLAWVNQDPLFLGRVRRYRDEIGKDGITFKMKARVQADDLLTTSWVLIHNPATPASVKADLIKSTVKWAGLEPKNDENILGAGSAAGGVKIFINMPDNMSGGKVIEHVEEE